MATLAGLSETGNAYSITITDTSVDAAALNTLDGKTTVAINASNITTLTGAAADLNTAYASTTASQVLSNEDVTLSDTTLDVSVLNTLDGNTSGTIDASSITTLTGAAADLITAYASNGSSQVLAMKPSTLTAALPPPTRPTPSLTATTAVVTATLSDGDIHTRWPQRNRQRLLHHHHGHLR